MNVIWTSLKNCVNVPTYYAGYDYQQWKLLEKKKYVHGVVVIPLAFRELQNKIKESERV